MKPQRCKARLELVSAALRHLHDSEHLLADGGSPDQAYHLAGFAPECARKAVLPKVFDLAIGHGVIEAAQRGVEFAVAFDPSGRRYSVRADGGPGTERWGRWHEGCRYEKTGTRSKTDATALVEEVRAFVDLLVASYWADGLIPEEFEWR